MTAPECDREYRVIDQMISMHSDIAQAKKFLSTTLNVIILLSSAIICALTFIDDATLLSFHLSVAKARFALGLISAIIFGLSIVDLRVDWDGIARSHQDAAKRLATLKAKYRAAYELQSKGGIPDWGLLSGEYSSMADSLEVIPEKNFNDLKAKYLFKRELSKQLSANPGVPLMFLAVHLRWKSVRRLFNASGASERTP